jgi:hypothetical protein
MKRGHVKGEKREKAHAQDWYKTQEEAHIRRIEAAWAVRQAQDTTTHDARA